MTPEETMQDENGADIAGTAAQDEKKADLSSRSSGETAAVAPSELWRAEAAKADTCGKSSASAEHAKAFIAKSGSFLKKAAQAAGDVIKALWADPLVCVKRLDAAVEWARGFLPPELFDLIAGWFAKLGHAGLIAASAVGALFYLAAAVKEVDLSYLLYGAGFVLLLIIVQYAAHQFLNAGRTLIQSSPSTLTSTAFLQCVALISEVVGILSLVGFVILAFRIGSLNPFWAGLGIAILCDAVAYVAIHPSLVNIAISKEASAGEEAIGIMSFFVKTFMRLIPVVFGTGVVLGTIAMLFATINVLRGSTTPVSAFSLSSVSVMELPRALADAIGLPDSARIVVQSSLLPFISYVVFAFYCLFIELVRAILALPKLAGKSK